MHRTTPQRPLTGRILAVLAGVSLLLLPLAGTAQAQQPEDPAVAPVTTRSADGLSATDGVRTLTISKAAGLNPDGEVIAVSGSGYNSEKGIYVAFCVAPEQNRTPTPCGGGADISGDTGASAWVSSNPPSYGTGLASAYGPGGSFNVQLTVGAILNEQVDCRTVSCAIVTRSDHTRTSDRSQDVIIPVTFADPSAVPTATPETTPPTATPVPPTPTPLPTATPVASVLAADGLSVSQGERQLKASRASGVAAGERVQVEGSGYAEDIGIYVALCALPSDGSPAPCATGSQDVSAWVSSNPPDYGKSIAKPYATGGVFQVSLLLNPVIDTTTDCRVVQCGIVTRRDDTSPADETDVLILPVRFAAEAEATATSQPSSSAPPASASADGESDDTSSNMVLIVAAVAALVVAAAGGLLFFRRRLGGGQ